MFGMNENAGNALKRPENHPSRDGRPPEGGHADHPTGHAPKLPACADASGTGQGIAPDDGAALPPPVRMLRLAQVAEKTGISRVSIHRLRKRGEFPAPLKLTARTVLWAEHELDAWLLARLASRAGSA